MEESIGKIIMKGVKKKGKRKAFRMSILSTLEYTVRYDLVSMIFIMFAVT